MFRNPYADGLILLLIVLLFLGPKRLPGLGKSLGHGMREFKDGITGKSSMDEDEDEDSDRPELTKAVDQPTSSSGESTPVSTPADRAS
jgi:sec-independent protein translocase protein TatA